jgi:DNA-binding response OmpR family regulator
VVYDISPPYESQLETFRKLRRTVFREGAVILTTTHPGRLQRWLAEGEVIDVCLKPCDVDHLVARIRTVLGQKAGATE